jgi:hypothetical protein
MLLLVKPTIDRQHYFRYLKGYVAVSLVGPKISHIFIAHYCVGPAIPVCRRSNSAISFTIAAILILSDSCIDGSNNVAGQMS